MTHVRIEGPPWQLAREALTALLARPTAVLVPPTVGYILLGVLVDRWFLALSELGHPSLAIASTAWLLVIGLAAVLHMTQLGLAPSVTVPAPPDIATRWRRLIRVWGLEAAAFLAPAVLIGVIDVVTNGALARAMAHDVVWRGAIEGVPLPGAEWVTAWVLYQVLHTAGATWLWPAASANYPSGTLKATALLSVGAGRRTAWLLHASAGSSLLLAAATWWFRPLGLLALPCLLIWPALMNVAAGRIRPA